MTAYEKPKSCEHCPYWARDYVPPIIDAVTLSADIALIGESPGREELRQGSYFVGPSGEVLDVLLQEVKLPRESVALLNVVRCDPGAGSNAVYDPIAVDMCTQLLWKDLRTINPEVIVPMGNLALKAILGHQGITRARGRLHRLQGGVRVIPTFHPAYVLRNPAYAELVAKDLDMVVAESMGERIDSSKKTDYQFFTTEQQVWEFFDEAHKKGYYSLDTETTSLDYRQAEVICMSLSHTPYKARVLPFFLLPNQGTKSKGGVVKLERKYDSFWRQGFLEKLYKHLLGHPHTTVYMHNGKYDLRILNEFFKQTLGRRVRPERMHWIDTQNMSALLNENLRTNLKDQSRMHTDIVYTHDELSLVSKGQVAKMEMGQLLDYAAQDADATLRLGRKFEQSLRSEGMWNLMENNCYSDMEVLHCLYDMELFGAPLSREKMQEMREIITDKLATFYGEMQAIVGHDFNPRSHPQIKKIIFGELQLPPTDIVTKTGQPSTDKHALEELIVQTDHQFPKSLRLHRQYATLLDTFIEGADKRHSKGRVHPDFLSARTVSGRIVCVNPNLANIPRDKEFEEGLLLSVRGIYVARVGWYILYADFSQIEFKCAALLSGDARLIHALFNEGADFHTLTAETLFPEFVKLKRRETVLEEEYAHDPRLDQAKVKRRLASIKLQAKTLRTDAKVYNFGQLYGGSDEGLAVLMGVSVERIKELTARRAEAYPELARFIEYTPQLCLEQGFLETAFGRKRRFPYSPDHYVRSSQGRQGINVGPQSSAAYVGRAALVRIRQRIREAKLKGFPFNVVYDAILNEHAKEELYEASMIMTEEMLRPVPELDNRSFSIDFGIGKSWEEAEKKAVKVSSALTSPREVDKLLPYVHQLAVQD